MVDNVYPMVTRSKAGGFKPKALTVDLSVAEPSSVREALSSPL